MDTKNRKPPSLGKKFLLLIWKNFILRRRHWVLTIFEILLPTLLFTLLLTLRLIPDSSLRPVMVNNVSTYFYIYIFLTSVFFTFSKIFLLKLS